MFPIYGGPDISKRDQFFKNFPGLSEEGVKEVMIIIIESFQQRKEIFDRCAKRARSSNTKNQIYFVAPNIPKIKRSSFTVVKS